MAHQKKYLNGAFLYRKKVLQRVSSYDPWIRGEEDRELGFRIRQANFELHELNISSAIHFVKKHKTKIPHRVKYYLGVGQVIRKYGRSALAIDLLRQYWFLFFASRMDFSE